MRPAPDGGGYRGGVSSAIAPAAPQAPSGRPSGRTPARWAPSPTWAHRILLANLVAQVGIVVTGGVVRLTGSGLGCSTWPQCEPGQFTPVRHEATSWHPFIEFGNRTLTGVLALVALATALVVWRNRDRARSYRLLGLVPLLGVAVQALVGGLTVLVDLHPAVVGSHMMISMVLVGASTALLWRHHEGDGPPRPVVAPATRALGRALVAGCAVVLVLGTVVTGAGPHSGDDEAAYRFALDPVAISRAHSTSVWLYVLGVVALLVTVYRSDAGPVARRTASTLLVVTLLQGAIGYVQYFTGLPGVLVAAHMLGASLLVVTQVRAVMALRLRA